MANFKIVQAEEELPLRPLVITVYGEPSMAKTSLGFTAQDPLLLDFDGCVHRAVGRKTTVALDSWEGVIELLDSGLIQEYRIQTIVVDTGGAMLDGFIARYVCAHNPNNRRRGGGVSQQGYQAIKEIFGEFVQTLRQMGLDLVVICHSVDEKDGERIRKKPKMTGASLDILLQQSDLVGYLETVNNKRVLNFNPTDRHYGKNAPEFKPIVLPHYTKAEWSGQLGRVIADTKAWLQKNAQGQREMAIKAENLRQALAAEPSVEEVVAMKAGVEALNEPHRSRLLTLWADTLVNVWSQQHLDEATQADHFEAAMASAISLARGLPAEVMKAIRSALVVRARTAGFAYVKDQGKFLPLTAEGNGNGHQVPAADHSLKAGSGTPAVPVA